MVFWIPLLYPWHILRVAPCLTLTRRPRQHACSASHATVRPNVNYNKNAVRYTPYSRQQREDRGRAASKYITIIHYVTPVTAICICRYRPGGA